MALRTLRRSPGYAASCILFLALAIGANTAMFSVVYAVVLKPLPYPNANRLVYVWERLPSLPDPIGPRIPAQRIVYEEWRRRKEIFSDMAAYHEAPLNEGGVERPRTLSVGYTSANLFPMLDASAAEGRLFGPDDEKKGRDCVVVLSDAYFERRFHRHPLAIGKPITWGGADYVVAGVLPRRFHLSSIYEGGTLKKPDVWVPLSRLWNRTEDDMVSKLFVMAVLREGVSLDRARTALSGLQARLNKTDSERFPVSLASIFPLKVEDQSKDMNAALYVLLGAVALLLLIGCANLANLAMVRATHRAREISVRRALGASRGRIVRQLLAESLVISTAGMGFALLLTMLAVKNLYKFDLPIPRPDDIELNWYVFVFAAGVSLVTTLLFGLAPAVTASNVSVIEALKSKGSAGSSPALARSRQILTGAEVSLAVILLCGSGLLIRSFVNMTRTDLGFSTEKLAVANSDLPADRYPDTVSRSRFYDALLVRVRAIPGVTMAGASTALPLKNWNVQTFAIAGRPKASLNELPVADVARVSPDYFALMGLPLRSGRKFSPDDAARNRRGKGEGVVIVNRAFAAKYFVGHNPLGQRLLLDDDRPFEIVGIAENFLAQGTISDAHPQYFVAGMDAEEGLLLLRTKVPPAAVREQHDPDCGR